MSRFNAIDMASEVACHPDITTHRSFFGFRTKATYNPTQSNVESYANYYDQASGECLSRLLSMSQTDIMEAIDSNPNIDFTEGNDYRLDICLSDDHKFLALRMFRASSGSYEPTTGIIFFTNSTAEKVESCLLK